MATAAEHLEALCECCKVQMKSTYLTMGEKKRLQRMTISNEEFVVIPGHVTVPGHVTGEVTGAISNAAQIAGEMTELRLRIRQSSCHYSPRRHLLRPPLPRM